MGHTIIFRDEIDTNSVQNLINQISQYEYVDLYFSTNGGYISEMMILINFLNERFNLNSIKVIFFDDVVSAGTLMLLHYDGPLFISPMFRFFLFHSPDISMNTVRRDTFSKVISSLLDEDNKKLSEDFKSLGLSKAEVKKIEDGEDVYITRNQLSRIKRKLFLEEHTVTQYKLIN